jgi:hypothetical protein
MSKFIVTVVENDFVEARWLEIEALVQYEFQDSNFNDEFTVERPLWHINEGIKGNLGKGIKHVIALNLENEIVAGLFCVPTCKNNDQTSCDLGWFFSSGKLSKIQKIKVLDRVFNLVHETVKNAGFEQIVTNMGTAEGAKYAERRWGYVNQPEGEKTNRWVKKLI